MRLNIQTKLFLALAGLTIIVLGGVLYLVTETLQEKIEEEIIADFFITRDNFNGRQNLVYDNLVESSFLIGENSTFKANVELNDPASAMFFC